MPNSLKHLLLSRTASEFSESIYPVVFPLYVLHISGSLATSGLFFTLIMIPIIASFPFMGLAIEHRSKKNVLLCSLALLCLIYLGLSILTFTHAHMSVLILGIFAALIGLASNLADLSTKVLFSEIVEKDQLIKYNGIKSILDNVASFCAPVLGTMIYGFWGFGTVTILSGIFYLVAIFFILPVKSKPLSTKISEKKTAHLKYERRAHHHHRKSSDSFLRHSLRQHQFLRASSGNITNPGILIQKYHLSTQLFGFVEVAFTIGVLLSGIFIARQSRLDLQKHLPHFFIANSLTMILLGAGSVLMISLNHVLYFSLFLMLQIALGIITLLINVPITAFYQSQVPIDHQSRFFSLNSFLGKIAISVGTLFTGFLAQKIGADWAYIFNNLCVILIVLLISHRKVVFLPVKIKKC